jgi:hypothetical protein
MHVRKRVDKIVYEQFCRRRSCFMFLFLQRNSADRAWNVRRHQIQREFAHTKVTKKQQPTLLQVACRRENQLAASGPVPP